MKGMQLLSLFVCFFCYQISFATTIIPYTALAELAESSDLVVLVRAGDMQQTAMINGKSSFKTTVKIIEKIKGNRQVGDQILLRHWTHQVGTSFRSMWGDFVLEKGHEYLVFLEQRGNEYIPKTYAYYIFEQFERAGVEYLVPSIESLEFEVEERPDGQSAEPLWVYAKENLISHLREVDQGKEWDSDVAKTNLEAISFYPNPRVSPDQCSFMMYNNLGIRWTGFPDEELMVYHGESGDLGCATLAQSQDKVQTALDDLNNSYGGMQISNGGSISYVPSCTSGSSIDDAYFDWVDTELGDGRNIIIQYEDLCGEIPDMNGCSGILAIGGLHSSPDFHSFDGLTWYDASYGYVIINGGVGSCICNFGDYYERFLSHELTHALGMGHIQSSFGSANMNPNCCIEIDVLDEDCLDYFYEPAPLAVDLISFEGEVLRNGSHKLKWVSASERNSEKYIIEHSVDGLTFGVLHTIESKNQQEGAQYEFFNRNPTSSINYYELKELDRDGQLRYLGRVILRNEKHDEYSLAPNPVNRKEALHLRMNAPTGEKMEILIQDVKGRIIYTQKVISNFDPVQINTEGIAAGIYLVQLRVNEENIIKKLVLSE